jgi:O-antigen/teichoic acid export membrane protein
MLSSKLLRGGTWLTVGNIFSTLISFARNIIVARVIGAEDYGIVVLLIMTTSVIEMGSNLAIDRMLVQANDGNDSKLQETGQFFQFVRGLMGAAILYLSATFIAGYFKIPETAWAFKVISATLVIKGLAHLDIMRYQREMRFQPSVMVEVIPQLVSIVAILPLLKWVDNYVLMVWIIFLQAMTALLLSHYFAERNYRWRLDFSLLYRFYNFGWPLLINALLIFFIFEGDKLLIAANFSLEDLGWFSAASALAIAPAMLLTKVTQSLLLPMLSNSKNEGIEFNENCVLAIQVCLYLGFLIGISFILIGNDLLLLAFGSSYSGGVGAVVILGVMQGIRVAKSGPMVVAMSCAETKIPMLANMVRILSFFVALALLSYEKNILAVVLVGLIGEAVAFYVCINLLSRRSIVDGGLFVKPPLLLLTAMCFLYSFMGWLSQSLQIAGRLVALVFCLVILSKFALSVLPELRCLAHSKMNRRIRIFF